ncbi:MAG: hypothetical protein Tsb0020_01420 [Haliangiales bacterium]
MDNGGVDNGTQTEEVGLTLSIPVLHLQQLSEESSTFKALVFGELLARNLDTGDEEVFDWSASFDSTSGTISSNRTVALIPGSYEFTLLLTAGSVQYSGSVGFEIADGTNEVPMVIRPIIGTTVVDVHVCTRLGLFRISYPPDELASLVDPRIGVSYEGGAEVLFAINSVTGFSEGVFQMEPGARQLSLKLYDGPLQVAKSNVAQESIVVEPGLDVSMDLVPLHGETIFSLLEDGGNAQFDITVPSEVVDEAGGVSNLLAQLAVSTATGEYREVELTLTAAGAAGYTATAVLEDMRYGEIGLSLSFADVSSASPEMLASCSNTVSLTADSRSVVCEIELIRRGVVGGNLLAVVGVNVVDGAGEPVLGALISEGGETLAMTGQGFGTPGYAKLFLFAGEHVLSAQFGTSTGSVTVDVDPLEVENVEITLSASVAAQVGVDFVDASSGALITETLTVRIEGEARDRVRDVDGRPSNTFTVDSGSLAFLIAGEFAPSPAAPANLTILVSEPSDIFARTYVSTSRAVAVVEMATEISIPLVSVVDTPDGVVVNVLSDGSTDSSGTVEVPFEAGTEPEPNTGVTTSISIPAGTVLTSDDGTPLVGPLTTEVAYFSNRTTSSLQVFPGGLSNLTLTTGDDVVTGVGFRSAGLVSIEITDQSGLEARSLSGGAEIEMMIPAGTLNPDTGVAVVAGDTVPVWYSETSDGQWHEQDQATVVEEFGQLVVRFTVDHLTVFNLDWMVSSCPLSRGIQLVNFIGPGNPENGLPVCEAKVAPLLFVLQDLGPDGNGPSTNSTVFGPNTWSGPRSYLQVMNAPDINFMEMLVFYDGNGNGIVDVAQAPGEYEDPLLRTYIFNDQDNSKLCDTGPDMTRTLNPNAIAEECMASVR